MFRARARANLQTSLIAMTVVVSLATIQAAEIQAAERPNVLFIAVDDMRVEAGCYGDTPALTPNIDRLAARGMLFRRAYCQQAVCNPSRASLLTGRRPDTLRVWNLSTHFRETFPEIVTLPQHFKRNGYFTQGIGKIFHNWRTEIAGDPESWSVPAVMHFATHSMDWVWPDGKPDGGPRKTDVSQSLDVPDDAYFDGKIANLAVEALRERRDAHEPFFLAVGFWKPHLPLNAPQKYWQKYEREQLRPPANPQPPSGVPPIALHDSRELRGYGEMPKVSPLTADQIALVRHGYYAAISFVDAQIGKVLDALAATGLQDNTIVVLWSDHGFHLGEHGLWCKTSNFEYDARVPLVIAAPDAPQKGAETGAIVELLDLYPTLVDLCGLEMPAGLAGESLRPLLADPSASVKPAAYTQHPRPAYYRGRPDAMGCSVRSDRFRYTEWRDFATGEVIAAELYDHQNDPLETRNVIDEPPDESAFNIAVELLVKRFPREGYTR